MKKSKILCAGSINIDLAMFMDTAPVPGETVIADQFFTAPGGKGANQAVAVARMGGDAAFLGRVGDDDFGSELLNGLAAEGIDTRGIRVVPNERTGAAMVRTDAQGINSISVYPGANAHLLPADVKNSESLFEECGILLTNLEIPLETAYAAIVSAKAHGMITILDPSPLPESPIPAEVAACVDYVKPNEIEAAGFLNKLSEGLPEPYECLSRLRALGFAHPILSLGEKGCAYLSNEEARIVPPPNVNPIDTTAAGDVFIGAFAAALSKGDSFEKAVLIAVCASALSTTQKGAQPSIPTYDRVQRFL